MTTVKEDTVQLNIHSLTEFAAAGQDAIAVVILSVLRYGRDVTQRHNLADYRLSAAKLCYIPRRCRCYQSMSQIELDPASHA